MLVVCSRGLGAVGGECVKKRGGGLCNEAERREKVIFFLAFKSHKKTGVKEGEDHKIEVSECRSTMLGEFLHPDSRLRA